MIEDYKLTNRLIADHVKNVHNKHKIVPHWLRDKKVLRDKADWHFLIQCFAAEIKSPIWEMCEDLLNGDFEFVDSEDGSTVARFTVKVRGLTLTVIKEYYMGTTTSFSPDITENYNEHTLLRLAMESAYNYHFHERHRDLFLEAYKGESNGKG